MYSALSGPTDWILHYIKTTFTFFFIPAFSSDCFPTFILFVYFKVLVYLGFFTIQCMLCWTAWNCDVYFCRHLDSDIRTVVRGQTIVMFISAGILTVASGL